MDGEGGDGRSSTLGWLQWETEKREMIRCKCFDFIPPVCPSADPLVRRRCWGRYRLSERQGSRPARRCPVASSYFCCLVFVSLSLLLLSRVHLAAGGGAERMCCFAFPPPSCDGGSSLLVVSVRPPPQIFVLHLFASPSLPSFLYFVMDP